MFDAKLGHGRKSHKGVVAFSAILKLCVFFENNRFKL